MSKAIVIGSMPVEFDLKSLIIDDDFIYCADRGYLNAQGQGIEPDVIIGDFDSAPPPHNTTAQVVQLPCEKDDTDSYYIARLIVEKGFGEAIFTGVTGGRIDHTIANIQMLKYLAQNGVKAKIVDRDSEIMVLIDGKTTLAKRDNCYFSLFSLGEKCEGITETGCKYELRDVTITNDFPIGVSNEFKGDEVHIEVKKGALLIVITRKD